ncbi:hypothetical protein HanIR_Chr13g0619691 [Helianthus annuus]|nr:hypothetical protein HanIR_Chr13g0619691 [Helianthus annuus]
MQHINYIKQGIKSTLFWYYCWKKHVSLFTFNLQDQKSLNEEKEQINSRNQHKYKEEGLTRLAEPPSTSKTTKITKTRRRHGVVPVRHGSCPSQDSL